ncbi:MAG: hypothetical protein QM779_00305 [Propionicimonas sp.]|uniref:hypothetical protein n=1 Tax=Propionicimonas sp. TaxID=1955623 RepID=UPI003D0AB017
MSALVRAVGVALAAVLLSGCGMAWLWNEPVHRAPSATPVATTPEASASPLDDRTAHPYTGALAEGATCVRAKKRQLADLEDIGGVGGSTTYPVGVLVRANAGWWTVAVATRTTGDGDVDPYAFFVTSYPTYADDPDHEPFAWQLASTGGDAAAKKALACVKKLPVPKLPPDPDSPDSYTGRLAKGAACHAVSAKLLARLQAVGGVGGAITYPRGTMVHANGRWWTVAVATKVNPNSLGYTSDNVDATALFVTNAPSAGSPAAAVSFPIKSHASDTAARKALGCLN